MRAATQILKIALPVQRYGLAIQVFDQFRLVLFVQFTEMVQGFQAIHIDPSELVILSHDTLHFLFNGCQIFWCQRPRQIKVIIKTVFNSRPNGKPCFRDDMLDSLCHNVGGTVPHDLKPLWVGRGNEFHSDSALWGGGQINQLIIDLGSDRGPFNFPW